MADTPKPGLADAILRQAQHESYADGYRDGVRFGLTIVVTEELFNRPGPQFGREPSLRAIIVQYYLSGNFLGPGARKLARDYITAVLKGESKS